MGFEENLKKLEKIVDELHAERLTLETSMAKFEDGVKLAGKCLKSLESMRKRVEILAKTKDGKVKIKPFEPEEAGG